MIMGMTASPSDTEDVPAADASAVIVDQAAQVEVVEASEAASEAPEAPEAVTLAGWDVSVVDVNMDAGAAMMAANEFNDPAEGTYVLVTIEGTCSGEGTGDLWFDLTFDALDTTGVIHSEAMGVTPADHEGWPTEARAGGTVQYQILFDVPNPEGLVMIVADWHNEVEFAL
jgi:hypothetical protein